MYTFFRLRMRGVPVAAAGLLALASCATGPVNAPAGLQGPGGSDVGSQTYMGRLRVFIVDQNGEPLERARIDLRSLGGDIWRRTVTTDGLGAATIDGVPQYVEFHAEHENGSEYGFYSQQLEVPQSGGANEVRIIMLTYVPEQEGEEGDSGFGF